MARFNALLIAAVIGATLSAVWRPGIPEIAIVALSLVACRAFYGRIMMRRGTTLA